MTPGASVLAALAALAAAPFVAEMLRTPVTRKVRENAPGQIAELPSGATHFRWSGPQSGPVAVCIHGLSTPSYVFAGTERALVGLGYRVLTFDLYGRGFSGRAAGAQTLDFFTAQTRALLAHQQVTGRLTIVGFSMGGAIATAFAAEEGTRIRALILAAPSGLAPIYDDWRSRLWTLPVVGDWATRVLGGWALRRELVEHRTTATIIPDLEDRQAAETRQRGFLPALLSSRRHALRQNINEDHRAIHRYGTPVLAIWGANDPVIPLSAMGRLAALNPDAHHVQIAGAGHGLLQSHPAQVSAAIGAFLKDR